MLFCIYDEIVRSTIHYWSYRLANKKNHRKSDSDRNGRNPQRPLGNSCGGMGANGARGRTKQKRKAARAARRANPGTVIYRFGGSQPWMSADPVGELEDFAGFSQESIESSTEHEIQRTYTEGGGVRITCLPCPEGSFVESDPRVNKSLVSSIGPWTKKRDTFLAEHAD